MRGISDAGLPAGAAALIRAAPTLKHAARTLGIFVFTLRRPLRALGGDGGEFHAPLNREQQGRQAVARVQGYVREHPGCSRTQVYRACKGDVVWLGRHQRENLDWIWREIPEKRAKQASLSFD